MDISETIVTLGMSKRSLREVDSHVQIPALTFGAWTSISQGVAGHKHHRDAREGFR